MKQDKRDKARKWTDKHLEEMVRRLNEIYSTAEFEMQEKWEDYIQEEAQKLDTLLKAAESPDATPEVIMQYQTALQEATLRNEYFRSMIDSYTFHLAHVNDYAVQYLNREMPKIYTVNYNHMYTLLEPYKTRFGISFNLVNEHTVKRMIENKEIKLYKTRVDIPKDMRWNRKNINSQMLQGILQGESIPKIAARLQNVTDMNYNAAVRNARTMTTYAENLGRQDSMVESAKLGIVSKREWSAVHDSRVRAWHLEMDGQLRDIDEPFENSVGKIRFPGDIEAAPENRYNCRCGMGSKIVGFRNSDGTIEYV